MPFGKAEDRFWVLVKLSNLPQRASYELGLFTALTAMTDSRYAQAE